MNELVTTSPAETFRGIAAKRLAAASEKTLHELVDEWMRLTEIMDAGVIDDNGDWHLSDEAEVASRERGIIVGVSKARFGIEFEPYDRKSGGRTNW